MKKGGKHTELKGKGSSRKKFSTFCTSSGDLIMMMQGFLICRILGGGVGSIEPALGSHAAPAAVPANTGTGCQCPGRAGGRRGPHLIMIDESDALNQIGS